LRRTPWLAPGLPKNERISAPLGAGAGFFGLEADAVDFFSVVAAALVLALGVDITSKD